LSTPPEEHQPQPPPDEARTRVLEQQPQPPAPPRGPRRSLPGGPWPWLAALLLLIVAGVVLAVLLTRDHDKKSTPDVSVPGLVGFSSQQATQQAHRVGLRTAVKEVLSTGAVGTVVAQNPAAGEQVPRGSLVVLNVAKGAPLVQVPDLLGLTEAQAGSRLSQVGLDSSFVRVTSSEPAGQVVGQDPQAGQSVKKGSAVTANVSKGTPTTTTTTTTTTLTHLTTTVAPPPPTPPPAPVAGIVPNVVGMNLGEAVNALANSGYLPRPKAVKSSKTPGTVLSQSPAAGTKAPTGSSVTIKFAGIPPS
jgi:beta-lactam-binding protein with PASTA domain